ncbi:MAG: YqaA family protein [Gammaproteobacteria bacterium]|jgi:membrane protein YqaA with SNARE-associated domain|nr:YqaA family protein [Gammaproteobacteria bacterium]
MRLFTILYDKVLGWARHPRAPWYLGGLSVAESSFFPIPPDVMLVPMVLARPERAWFLASLTTIASVVGGVLGYLIGMFAFQAVEPLLHRLGHWDAYLAARDWFDAWGVWVIFLAGVSPIPYKVFTIAAGAVAMALAPFILASLIGRGARFFLVAALMRWGGARVEPYLRRYVDIVGWLVVAALVVLYLLLR